MSGAVIKAVHKKTKRNVAVKILRKTEVTDETVLNLMASEVEIYLKLDHPNICQLLEVYEEETRICFVMELCSGPELYTWLLEKTIFSELDAKRIMRDLLQAVAYLHWQNICHRDIKLENFVFQTEDENSPLKLLDFGLSRILTHDQQPMKKALGTIYYVAPETLEGMYGRICDMWSAGVIMYMLLTGYAPFDGRNDAEILKKIRSQEIDFDVVKEDEARDLLKLMLTRDQNARISAEKALQHTWIQSINQNNNAMSSTIVTHLRKFAERPAFTKAMLGLCAYHLQVSGVDEVKKAFKTVDVYNKGVITKSDFIKTLSADGALSPEEANYIFSALDQDDDTFVQYTEFLAACLEMNVLKSNAVGLRYIFDRIDIGSRGYISTSDLKEFFGSVWSEDSLNGIMADVDRDNDDHISYEEFKIEVSYSDANMAKFQDAIMALPIHNQLTNIRKSCHPRSLTLSHISLDICENEELGRYSCPRLSTAN